MKTSFRFKIKLHKFMLEVRDRKVFLSFPDAQLRRLLKFKYSMEYCTFSILHEA